MEAEQNQTVAAILKIHTLNDLKASLPPSVTEKLGEGNKGLDQTVGLLVGLTFFSPEDTIDRDAFNAIVARDFENGNPLSNEDAQTMFEVALEAGFIQLVKGKSDEFMVKAELQEAVGRVISEY